MLELGAELEHVSGGRPAFVHVAVVRDVVDSGAAVSA